MFENFWYRKMLGIREGAGITILSKLFCLTVPNHFVDEPFCFRKFRVSKNFMPTRGISRFSIENFSHSTEKLRSGTLFHKLSGIEKIYG